MHSPQRESGPGVGAQYCSTHVYLFPHELETFAGAVTATLGGTQGESHTGQVTPTPSQVITKPISTPAGNIVAFAFTSPIPYPFGMERSGCLVRDLDEALQSACAYGADLVVGAFQDPVGRDAIILWPGAVYMQLYSHAVPPSYPPLTQVPEYRVYLPPRSVDAFVAGFAGWSNGEVISDDPRAPGIEIGRPEATYRRVRLSSTFGKLTVLATDGALPYPFGRELTGFEVTDLKAALKRGTDAGLQILVPPFHSQDRLAAVVRCPGGFIAELHTEASLSEVSARPATQRNLR
jgi:hypothetical protein